MHLAPPFPRSFVASLVLAVCCVLGWSQPSVAHRDGCHAQHSCPSDSGSYVCGDTGNFSECPYSTLPDATEPEVEEEDWEAPNRPAVSGPKARRGGRLLVTVEAEAGSKLVVKSGGKVLHRVTANGGRQVMTFKGVNGTRRYAVVATDTSGNTSSAARFKASADAVAPSLEDASIAVGSPENAYTRLTFASDETARYYLTVDGRRVETGKSNTEDKNLAIPLADGRHRLVLKVLDAAGNSRTLKRSVTVRIPHLSPNLETLSEPGERTQRFTIAGTPGSRGTLRIAGKSLPVELKSETAEVDLDLPDGDYAAGELTLRDELGRTGTVAVPALTVDTTKPTLRVVQRTNESATGRLVALIAAETGARVVWRLFDSSGEEIEEATYVATDRDRTVDVDVADGTATLEVEASDGAGNSADDEITATIERDPLTALDWITTLIVLALISGLAALMWRHRRSIKAWAVSQRHASALRKARRNYAASVQRYELLLQQHQAQLSVHHQQLSAWENGLNDLERLRRETETATGAEITESTILDVKVRRGERVYVVVSGSLLEQRTRENVPNLVDVEGGRVVITNLRVLFRGHSKKREWAFDKLDRVTHLDPDATLLSVTNRKTLSGVRYDNPERTRLLLTVALDPTKGRREAVGAVAAMIRRHRSGRPVEPPPAPLAPVPPAILSESGEKPAAVVRR
jgi:hypothetical protein